VLTGPEDAACYAQRSDRGLAKACAAANDLVPECDYWNKLHAGHKVYKTKIPSRELGQSDEISTVHCRK
jgi:hypothetical protein